MKKFSNIADPGADRILLFAGIAPIAAVPSNCPQVLVRILHGQERENYGVNYREAQQAIAAEVPETLDARKRAYLLLKRHGQEICKRTKPKCEKCPVNSALRILRRPSPRPVDAGVTICHRATFATRNKKTPSAPPLVRWPLPCGLAKMR